MERLYVYYFKLGGFMWFEQELDINQTKSSKEKETLYKIIRLSSILTKVTDKFLVKYGITESQYKILELLASANKKGMTQVEISEKLLVNRSNITGLIDRLEKNGFVVRSSSQKDRRINIIKLKEKARKTLASLSEPYLNEVADIMKFINKDEIKTLSYLLNKIEKHFEKENLKKQ